jgi:SHAQKYF class myb-like DNA-binding protein
VGDIGQNDTTEEKINKKGRKKKAVDGEMVDKLTKKQKSSREGSFNTGRWQPDEHQRFIEAILKYGNEWKMVQKHVLTRSSTQARSHAQKFFVKIKKTNLLDFNIDLNKNSIKSLHEQANQMNSDQYFNTIKTLNNIAFEKKSGVRQRKRKDEISATQSDEAVIGTPDKSNGSGIKPSSNIKILTISNEPENFYKLYSVGDGDKNIIINNNINNINISFNSNEKSMFLNKKRKNSIDAFFNDMFNNTVHRDSIKIDDEFQNFFFETTNREEKGEDNVDINFMDLFQQGAPSKGDKNTFGTFEFSEDPN